jgi:hypothetical protein
MRPNNRTIKNASDFVVANDGRSKDVPPNIASRPVAESVVHRLPIAVSTGKIAPRYSRLRNPQHAVDEVAIRAHRWSPKAPRQQAANLLPLFISELVSSSHLDGKIKK